MKREEMPANAVQRCASCGAEIVWVLTDRDKRMPVDADPAPEGTYAVRRVGEVLRISVVSAKLAFGRRDLHRSHFVGCPQSRRWSGSGRRR